MWAKQIDTSFHLSVAECVSAAGFVIPTLFITPGERLDISLRECCPVPDAKITTSATGWMNESIFSKWLDMFSESVPSTVQRPVLLLFDGLSMSSTAAEYVAASDGMLQAEWIKLLLDELLQGHADPIDLDMKMDNDPAIRWIKKDGTSTAKTIDIRFHYIKDCWKRKVMSLLDFVPTTENAADLLTKSLARTELDRTRKLCGLSRNNPAA